MNKRKVRILKAITPPGFFYKTLVGNEVVIKHDIVHPGDVIEVDPNWGSEIGLKEWEWYDRAIAGNKPIAKPVSASERVTAYPLNGAWSDGKSRTQKQNPLPAKADANNSDSERGADGNMD